MNEDIQKIIDECKEKTRIKYLYHDGFFKPRLKGINHLEVGYSKVISSPVTIALEFIYLMYEKVRNAFDRFGKFLFPRKPRVFVGHLDSYLTGKITHANRNEERIPIHNLKIEFWARTKWLKWRKLGEAFTDENGDFNLPFTLREARNWQIKKNLFAEVYQPFKIGYKDGMPFMIDRLYHRFKIKKSNLIGMGYNLRNIHLPLWEYRTDINMPRAFFPNNKKYSPEVYDRGREYALMQQVIPIELTKQKHLFQIQKEPGLISISDIQNDYPENLTVCIEKRLPGYTRGDEWFAERMMNGMNKCSFIPNPADPSLFTVKLFGICHYDHNLEYALPNVEMVFKQKQAADLPLPISLSFTGALNAIDRNPWQTHTFMHTDGAKWEQAKRLARTVGAVVAEADDHFAGTHVNTEQFAIAAFRNFRKNPVAFLLYPHLKEVSLINAAADKTIIGGYLPTATALTENGFKERVYDMLGFQNWKGWEPMKPINDKHRFARAENLFWDLLGQFVDYFFELYQAEIKNHWSEVYAFSQDLVKHSVPVFLSEVDEDKLSPEQKDLNRQRFEYGCYHFSYNPAYSTEIIDGKRKVLSPITKTPEFKSEEDFQNLKDCCRYAIMMATFSHTWINEHQYDDLGEILYNCGGLRFGEKPHGVMAPESDLEIAPDLTCSTQMLWFTNLLSRTEYGFITENTEHDIHPYFIKLMLDHKEDFAKLGVDIESIESRTNI
jgi:hypothetical protein